jgi:hypothetical protein
MLDLEKIYLRGQRLRDGKADRLERRALPRDKSSGAQPGTAGLQQPKDCAPFQRRSR